LSDRDYDHAQHCAAVLATVHDAVISTDSRFIITSWNPAAERLFGNTAAEAVGQPSAAVIVVEGIDREQVRAALLAGQTARTVVRARHKDGQWFDLEGSTAPMRDGDGRVIGVVSALRDVSETKRLERELEARAKELARSNADLEQFA
jgi:PAS domain S-box-containing protein